MKKIFAMLMIVAAVTVMYRCNPVSEREEIDVSAWNRNIDDEKNETIQELTKLKEVVEKQLQHISSKAKAVADDDSMQAVIISANKRLLVEQKQIKAAMFRVSESSENKWNDVKEDMREKITDMRIEISRVNEKIKNEIDVNNKSKDK